MRLWRVVLGRVLLLVVVLCPGFAMGAERPNILFVFLDDFGWKDTAFMGSDYYETPHIDALANGGMVFTNAYSCSANCAPARACLLSGQYTPRHRIFNVGTKPRGDARFRRLQHVVGTNVLSPRTVTWAETLKASGYRTGMFGKWHLGTSPSEQGFDVEVQHNKLPGFRGHLGPDGAYLADVLTDRTIEFIEESKDGPWCAYLAHFAVHTPLQPKKDLLPKYEAKPKGELHDHAIMATMIQAVDDGVGRIIQSLEDSGERENTVIVFFSDNGGYGPATDMDPLWGYKGTYYEGGIRVPFFVNWPGVVKAGQESSEPIIGVDVYPTLAEIGGAKLPSDQPGDGQSLVSLFKGETKTLGQRPLFWHFPAYLQSYEVFDEQRDPLFRSRPCSVVRLGDYKLHQYFEDGGIELYNLKDDVREQKNLATQMPEKRDELMGILESWRKDVNAPVPTELNPKFNEDAEAAAIAKAKKGGTSKAGRKKRTSR